MSSYAYEALDISGRTKRGTLSADSLRQARNQLRDAGLSPLKLDPVAQSPSAANARKASIKKSELPMVTRQLATLIDAGTTVEEALQAVAAQMDKTRIANTLLSIRGRVMEGWRLSDALAEHDRSFSQLYRGIAAAGETSGDLGGVLARLADMLEKNRAMAMKAVTALIYPAVLVVVASAVVTGLMVAVVPKIVEQFATLDAKLPFVTRLVIGVSQFLQNWGLALLLVLMLGGVGVWRGLKIPGFKLAVDKMILRLPLIGKLARELDAARFGRTLSTLFASGTPLLDGLQAARKTVTNSHLHAQLGTGIAAVREGASLSAGLKKSGALPSMMVYMIAAGERSGELPMMLDKTAEHMEQRFEATTTLALRLLEPMIIVGMGVVVLGIVMAILVPILQINSYVAA